MTLKAKPKKFRATAVAIDFPTEKEFLTRCVWDVMFEGRIGEIKFSISKRKFLKIIQQL